MRMHGNSHAERVKEALGGIFMDIICSVCGSEKVIGPARAVFAPSAARVRAVADRTSQSSGSSDGQPPDPIVKKDA